ncbi:Crp/Fnr family transcriptional regulator [Flavobacterium saccharophilum]|uniref:cAMP-binding domain of CRP or a regulatory subunit of cAMP-dependent protein kinases n=1 Tax=Flavobacterium saccharophilum TaxID=29534 RepID=A0A1M7FUF7_9FLAO|nr:Crp/Fnr family transcriptional regulator [Flavobacterium saccharophilum]SHM07570.1 cAMP-binding domain of CRP or a regulatory subunit of cAMP-dependent protein kinases [Flavobacterium saccharophilum]
MSENFQKYSKLLQIDIEHFEDFFSLLRCITLEKGELFLKQDDECQYIGFVKHGTMRSFYISESGNDISFNFHFINQFFADYESLLYYKKSKLNIEAVQRTELLILHKEDLKKLYEKGAYWQEFGRKMKEKLYIDAKKRIEDLLYYTPEKRYINLMTENPSIFQEISQKQIASYLGVTPQSLSRIRKRIFIS